MANRFTQFFDQNRRRIFYGNTVRIDLSEHPDKRLRRNVQILAIVEPFRLCDYGFKCRVNGGYFYFDDLSDPVCQGLVVVS